MPGGISKREYLDYQIRSSLAEGSRFDLIAMGRGKDRVVTAPSTITCAK
jgi:hypothetical protein